MTQTQTPLSLLQISACPLAADDQLTLDQGESKHTTHLRTVLNGITPALANIQKLFIHCAVEEQPALADLLPPLCAATLTSLHLEGFVPISLLAALGQQCVKPVHITITATANLHFPDAARLQQIMPTVSDLSIVAADIPMEQRISSYYPSPVKLFGPCLTLVSTQTVTSLSIRNHLLDTFVWQLLPAGIRHLVVGSPRDEDCLPLDAQVLLALETLELTNSNGELHDLSAIFSCVNHVPTLRSLQLSREDCSDLPGI